MRESEFQLVCRQIWRGAKYNLGRNAAGRLRLKIYSGPFGLFVKRYSIDQEELEVLRNTLAKKNTKTRTPLGNDTQDIAA